MNQDNTEILGLKRLINCGCDSTHPSMCTASPEIRALGGVSDELLNPEYVKARNEGRLEAYETEIHAKAVEEVNKKWGIK